MRDRYASTLAGDAVDEYEATFERAAIEALALARIEDYALIGDLQHGGARRPRRSIDWLCLPRFDSGACFAALLGDADNGRWLIAPQRRRNDDAALPRRHARFSRRRARPTRAPSACSTSCRCATGAHDVVRIVEGDSRQRGDADGARRALRLRARRAVGASHRRRRAIAIAGPDALVLRARPPSSAARTSTRSSTFTVARGRARSVRRSRGARRTATRRPRSTPRRRSRRRPRSGWHGPTRAGCDVPEAWRDVVRRSLIVLQGAHLRADRRHRRRADDVAAGADRRRAQLGLPLLLAARRDVHAARADPRRLRATRRARGASGCSRAVAGDPSDMQIMYGVAGERRLTELELPWLAGYEGSAPVRIGNAASEQLQLDVYGEVIDALYQARGTGFRPSRTPGISQTRRARAPRRTIWHEPDDGIWEIRGERRHFTHSKVMAWVAFDRAVRSVEEQGDRRARRALARACATRSMREICARGFDAELGSFTQSYGSTELDASLLLDPARRLPAAGRPARARHGRGRSSAISSWTASSSATARRDIGVDGLPAGEGVFLPCSFWLVDNLALLGRHDEAHALFERLARASQRRRPALGGVRPDGEAPARQLPAGVHPRRARQLRVQPLAPRPVPDAQTQGALAMAKVMCTR